MAIRHTRTVVQPVDGIPSYATYDDFLSANLGIDVDSISQEDVEALLEQMSRMIDDYTKRVFYKVIVTDEKRPVVFQRFSDSLHIETLHKPIDQVLSISITGPLDVHFNISDSYWNVMNEQGYVDVFFGIYLDMVRMANSMNDIRGKNSIISYTAGFDEIPAAVKRATLLLLRNTLFPGMNLSGAKLNESLNGGVLKKVQSQDYLQEVDTKSGAYGSMAKVNIKPNDDSLFTNDIKALLRPYIRTFVG